MRFARLFFGVAILLCALVPAHAQDYSNSSSTLAAVSASHWGTLATSSTTAGTSSLVADTAS